VTEIDWPPSVNVAARAAPVLALTVRLTVPLPLPVPPLTAIHEGAPARVHEHPAPAVTVRVDGPPAAGGVIVAGLTE